MVSLRSAPGIIVTRTPLRVSFAGGGTDLAAFYEHGQEYGAVLSSAIANYIYVTVKAHSPTFNESVRINYSKSEEVSQIDEIENDIARECLLFLGIEPPIYISTVGDHPASSGLGGSSAFTVGLLNALHAFKGERVTAGQLAEEASHIEIDVLGEPIGKQDQYAAAFGGVNCFRFRPGGAVTVEAIHPANGSLQGLFDHLMMFWTGHQRDASVVLTEQKRNSVDKRASLVRMRDQALELQQLMSEGDALGPSRVGAMLDEGWKLKRALANAVSNPQIDMWYDRAMEAGAWGGKLCGAGGGGCMLFVVDSAQRDAVRAALSELIEVPITHEVHGSRVLLPPGD